MKRILIFTALNIFCSIVSSNLHATIVDTTSTPAIQPTTAPQSDFIRYEFSSQTANENKVTLQGAGFGAYPQANVSFGYIPTDNAFDGATDGQGAIITAQPGEGVMIFGERVDVINAAMIRSSVRTEQGHAAVTIAVIGDTPDRFVATNSPYNEAYFAGQYQRLAVFYTPPSTGFQPVVQIVNTSKTETLTAYLDNLEVYPLNPSKYYSAAFLDNDTIDPPADKISLPASEGAGFITDPTPVIPADFKAVANPGSNTAIDISWSFPEILLNMIFVYRSTTGNEDDWTPAMIFYPSENLNISFTDSNLLPNTLYYYRLFVLNAISGYSAYSDIYSARTNP